MDEDEVPFHSPGARDESDEGAATVEYALVTVAAAALAAVLVALMRSPEVRDMLFGVISDALAT